MNKDKKTVVPDCIFEVSWEVCNKVGGINTVIATKAKSIKDKIGDNYILIGPDLNINESVSGFLVSDGLEYITDILTEKGIKGRVGRWDIEGQPIVILIDFKKYFDQKDEILTDLWNEYKIDSLSGGWDYIEPVIFGVAAAKVIEAITTISLIGKKASIIAHFHEWMTASGGLYLKKYHQGISTVFTTHATILGRSIAGNDMKLYKNLENFNSELLAKQLGIYAKFSMEKTSAKYFDAFSTVSNVTAKECEVLLGATPTMVTPNGFENGFVWEGELFDKKRSTAKNKLKKVAEVLLGKNFKEEPFIIGTSGRYEFQNKGIDLFIKALDKLSYSSINKEIIAFITVPAGQNGVRKDLLAKLEDFNVTLDNNILPNITHYLTDYDNDPVINSIKNTKLVRNESNVHVIFVPCYIDFKDGLFNCSYYELLAGMDMTIYPSYYEPWGYTPMESIAFSIPTVTTSLSGFGQWINEKAVNNISVTVIERNDLNKDYVTNAIASSIENLSGKSETEMNSIRKNAKEISQLVTWDKLTSYYWELYSKTLQKGQVIYDITKYQNHDNKPTWVRLMVERDIPESIKNIEKIARNLWWSWTPEGEELFKDIDIDLWRACDRNPIDFLDRLSYNKLKSLESNHVFIAKLDALYAKFEDYMNQSPEKGKPKIAYFSMEYGLINFLKIFSGGLGILAGDYLKEASDKNTPMIAVGLLYHYGYFSQKLSASGAQEASYDVLNVRKLPLTPITDKKGLWITITINMLGRDVFARIWRCDVGRTKLFLLDTDFERNVDEDRSITHHLYGGDWENRLKQEILLGIGGIKALKEMDIEADIYHCNEGHAAFIGLERVSNLISNKSLTFDEALEIVRSSSLFTTHTPVPAGHDAFSQDMIKSYLYNYVDGLKITWERFLRLGMVNIHDTSAKFSMSHLACAMSQEVNGVSWLHGEVSKEILKGQWPGYFPNESHISYVTNGVHLPTWTAASLQKLYSSVFKVDLTKNEYAICPWKNIYETADNVIWEHRLALKERLINTIKERISNPTIYRFESPRQMIKVKESIKPDILTIGFARRFATYKRAHLLFENLDRLDHIINNPDRPVQFIFAGKAHPNDKPGQDLIKHIVEVSRMPRFMGKIIFLQNYDMNLAKKMVQGVDVWLNTPTRPLEASGTSGEKAAMNGVLHFSVLDGWWVEGYVPNAGWALPMKPTFEDTERQNEVDSELIYNTIEEQIVPLYYTRDKDNIPTGWVNSVKKCIAEIASKFNTYRMMTDYEERFYNPLFERSKIMYGDDYKKIRELAAWKNRVHDKWGNLHIMRVTQYDVNKAGVKTGDNFITEVTIDLGGLLPSDIGVELVISNEITNGKIEVVDKKPFILDSIDGNIAKFTQNLTLEITGTFDIAVRVYSFNALMAHRQDFALVKWA